MSEWEQGLAILDGFGGDSDIRIMSGGRERYLAYNSEGAWA